MKKKRFPHLLKNTLIFLVVSFVVFYLPFLLRSQELIDDDAQGIILLISSMAFFVVLPLWMLRGVYKFFFVPTPVENATSFDPLKRLDWLEKKLKKKAAHKKFLAEKTKLEEEYADQIETLRYENLTPDQQTEKLKGDLVASYRNRLEEYKKDPQLGELNLFALLLLPPIWTYGEKLKAIKEDFHPIVRLLVVYSFLEHLSENYSEETASITQFAFDFLKSELSPSEWTEQFPDDDEYYLKELPLGERFTMTQALVDGVLDKSEADEDMRQEACADICTDLTEDINDPDLISRFVDAGKKSLIANNLFSNKTEFTFASLELHS